MKKFKLFYIFLLFSLLFFITSINVFADETDKKNNYENEKVFEKIINIIEEDLSKFNTNCIDMLDTKIDNYNKILLNIENEKKELQIQKMIKLNNDFKENILNYKSKGLTLSDIYHSAASAASLWFQVSQENLASELIEHFGSNTDLDSFYSPSAGMDVLSSSVYTNIKNSSILKGNSEFPNAGDTNDIDLYHSIHYFYYSKSESNRAIVIKDRYDFEHIDEVHGFDDYINNLLNEGQENGYLLPFYTLIESEHISSSINPVKNFTISSSARIFEDSTVLGTGEYVDYYITFPTSGIKNIQTFGIKDTYLYVYQPNGQILNADDDAGYMLNSMLNCNITANVQYMIRIIFVDSDEFGEIKINITWPDGNYANNLTNFNYYYQILNTSSTDYTLNTTGNRYHTKLHTYTPSDNYVLNIYTIGYYDTYLYLIDPRSTYDIIGSSFENDDGGNNLNARITKRLSKDIDYLIIYSNFSMDVNTTFTLKINN